MNYIDYTEFAFSVSLRKNVVHVAFKYKRERLKLERSYMIFIVEWSLDAVLELYVSAFWERDE